MEQAERVIILVVKDESVFTKMLQHFPLEHYELLFAEASAEAIALCETRKPRLILIPTAFAGEGLADVLAEVRHEDALIMGTAPNEEEAVRARKRSTIFDRVVIPEEGATLPTAVREMLEERRQGPRVYLEFPIELGDGGEGIVREFSATSLRVETDEELRGGSILKVKIGWGPKPLQFRVIVGRIQRALFFAQHSVVLHVQEKELEAKAYLDKLVRGVVELQHIIAGEEEGGGKLRGDAAWELTRRAESTLRDSKGLIIRDSGELAVVTELADDEEEVTERLEARYELGAKIGRWGVGDVYEASHKLLGRPVTLKRLAPEFKGDEQAQLRMELEARCAVIWTSPNIVDVLDFGSDGQGGLYYAMERLTGETLAEALDRGMELTPLEAATLGVHLADALTKLHLRGGGHFDLCPASVFLHRPGGTTVRPILINVAGRELWGNADETHALGGDYRSPAVADDKPPGPADDVYSLALVLAEVLASGSEVKNGKRSLGAEHLAEMLRIACSDSESERFADSDAFRHAVAKSLAVLETEQPSRHARLIEPPGSVGRSSVRPTPIPSSSRLTPRANSVSAPPLESPSSMPPTPVPRASGVFSNVDELSRRTSELDVDELHEIEDVSSDAAEAAPPVPPKPPVLTTKPIVIPPPPPPPGPPANAPAAPVSSAPAVSPAPVVTAVVSTEVATTPERSPLSEVSAALGASEALPDASEPIDEAESAVPARETIVPSSQQRGSRWRFVLAAVFMVAGLSSLIAALAIWQPWRREAGLAAADESGSASHWAVTIADAGPAKRAVPGSTVVNESTPAAAAAQTAGGGISQPGEAPDAGIQATIGQPDAQTIVVVGEPDAGATAFNDGAEDPDDGAEDPGDVEEDPDDGEDQDSEEDESELSPNELRRRYIGKARRRIRVSLYGEALEYIDQARRIRGGSDIHYLHAQIYEKRGRYRPAIDSMRQAIASSPSRAGYHDYIGTLYRKVGRRASACDAFRRALTINSRHRGARRHAKRYCRSRVARDPNF